MMDKKLTCKICRWNRDGICHKNPPIVIMRSQYIGNMHQAVMAPQSVWPKVSDNDWCGKWEALIV